MRGQSRKPGIKRGNEGMLSDIVRDEVNARLAALLKPALRWLAHTPGTLSKTTAELERQKIAIYPRHYYHPFISRADLRKPLSEARALGGIQLDAIKQLKFIEALEGRHEIASAPEDRPDGDGFYYRNGSYEHGDADLLYSMIRTFKPRMVLEIGSGMSTRVARKAIRKNVEIDPAYRCRHLCVEPYEQKWLEEVSVELIRERVELLDKAIFSELDENDILFIDSSHVIRPQGDVLFEYLEVLPALRKGVIIHIHDIFTPFDYPEEWLFARKVLWNEQYLLEAFLSFNDRFETLIASNWLARTQNEAYAALLPAVARNRKCQPGNFWIRRTV